MGEVILEIMSEEYRKEYCEKHTEINGRFVWILHSIHEVVRRRALSDGARPFCRCCSRAICLTVSRSIWQSYSANTCHFGPITHSVLAAARLVSHQLESQLLRCDLSTDTESSSSIPLGQVQSSNFSPVTHPSWSPTYSPEWVTLHHFSSAFRVSSCQAEWLWPIANLKSLMSWNWGLLQVQNIRFKKNVLQGLQVVVGRFSCLP